ncbi:Uncharacterised protein [Klebsiella pneumoniae]|nr:Uncharacterised protein [Klebsiella pneumoniae]SWT63493.1 Uncharacterised protein [Klebsiella pneumoniae]
MFLVGGKTPDQSVHLNLTTTSFVEVWNLEDEHELVLSSVNVSVSRYWMMLEIGSGPSGPVYIDVKRDGYPLLLVSPRKLQQLYQALGEVPHE